MTCSESAPLELWRFESRTITVTVVDPETGFPVDISAGEWQLATLEFEIKPADDDPDPALVTKAIGSGIVVLVQSGDTLGQAEIDIAPTDITFASGLYRGDCVAVFTNGRRILVLRPFDVVVMGVVNLP